MLHNFLLLYKQLSLSTQFQYWNTYWRVNIEKTKYLVLIISVSSLSEKRVQFLAIQIGWTLQLDN